ncbi:MAG TPA: DUF2065 domain-containing protein [Steroidobacteraceae bacterium]|nr:DUF2065 domain-containing protein [Steroidobacteraceae bacterium]
MRIDWPDFAAAFGLLLVIEGVLPFLNPASIKRAMAAFSNMSDTALRVAGLASMAAGLALLWLVRS